MMELSRYCHDGINAGLSQGKEPAVCATAGSTTNCTPLNPALYNTRLEELEAKKAENDGSFSIFDSSALLILRTCPVTCSFCQLPSCNGQPDIQDDLASHVTGFKNNLQAGQVYDRAIFCVSFQELHPVYCNSCFCDGVYGPTGQPGCCNRAGVADNIEGCGT